MNTQQKYPPLFYIETRDKVSNKKFYINFEISSTVEYPKVDYEEAQLVEKVSQGSKLEEYKVPMIISPIYWSKAVEDDTERNYVIHVIINDKYAIRRIITSQVLMMYLIEIAMLAIEEKYNSKECSYKTVGQFLGHKLDLNFREYKTATEEKRSDRSEELVNNKVTVLEEIEQAKKDIKQYVDQDKIEISYRPASKILTCAILVDKLPSFGFNDDRIIVTSDDKTIVDVHLPFNIDLSEPAKYRFYDQIGVIKIVFRIK